MTVLDAMLSSHWVLDLGWTLVHFLWQGAAVGLIYWLARCGMRGWTPNARYRLAMATLGVLVLLPICTFFYLLHGSTGGGADSSPALVASIRPAGSFTDAEAPVQLTSLHALLGILIPWITPLWLLGASVMVLRVGYACRYTRRLRATAYFAALPDYEQIIKSLCIRLRIRTPVQIALSSLVEVPSVVGWVKPLVLLPASAITGLAPWQLELILMHELMHIRRWDYFWNFLQTLIEALLYYHPVVRWVSHEARLEREQCCDDAVVKLHGGAIEYARTLTELESLRHPQGALLLGANGGQLVARIRRLAGQPVADALPVWLPLLVTGALLLGAGLAHYEASVPVVTAISAKRYTFLGQPWRPREPAVSDKPLPSRVRPQNLALWRLHPVSAAIIVPFEPPTLLPALQVPVQPMPVVVRVAPDAVRQLAPNVPSVTSPRVISSRVPVYPAFALERGETGSATIEFTLTPTGAIKDLHVIRVVGSRLFASAAMNAIRRWTFAAARRNGVPVAKQISLTFLFHLHEAPAGSQACRIPIGYHVCVG